MRRWIPCLAPVLLAVTLAACGKADGLNVSSPKLIEKLVEPVCPEQGFPAADPNAPAVERSPVPENFVTASVLRCRTETREQPGQGMWMVQVSERAETPATQLVAELRKPSEPRSGNPCTLEMVVPPVFFLVNANGQAVIPAIPSDGCAKPRREVLAELDKLPFTTVSERKLNQVQSPESQQSGCSDTYKDGFAIQAKDARRSSGPALSAPVSTLVVCVYDGITGDQLPVGKLSASRPIEGAAATNVVAALDRAGPAADCSAPHTRYAVLSGPGGVGGQAMIELDGCHRLLRADNTLGQLDPAAVELISR